MSPLASPESSTPLVSVVIPAYNAAETIQHAIASALAQSHRNIEIVVCDDFSMDPTADLVAGLTDPRVRLVRNSRNLGPGPSRDAAIAIAKGEWIAFLDADDAWDARRIERLLAEARDGEMVFDDILLCPGDGDRFVAGPRVHGKRGFGCRGASGAVDIAAFLASDRLLIQPMIPARALRALGIAHSSRRFGEDAEFYLKLALAGMPMRYVPSALYFYRVTSGSLTALSKGSGEMQRMLEGFLDHPAVTGKIRAAFLDKIRRLELDERGHTVERMVRNGELDAAIIELARAPALCLRIFRRLPARLKLEIHRLITARMWRQGPSVH